MPKRSGGRSMSDHSTKLTSGELATLWTTYQNDTSSLCMIEYFLAKCEDPKIKDLLLLTQQASLDHVTFLKKLYEKEQIPQPAGFDLEKDVDPDTPRMYEDIFFLMFMRQMSKVGMITYSGALSLAVREDIINFYQGCLNFTSDLYQKTTETTLDMGILVRPPYMPYPKGIGFVEEKDYFSGSLNPFTEKRPLNAIEISHLFMNTETNLLGNMLTTSFAQMAETPDVKDFMVRAQQIAQKHIKIFGKTLVDNDMQAPMSWDTNVQDSTTPVFSEKLMMFTVALVMNAGIGNYGTSASASMRLDVSSNYLRMAVEAGRLGKSGADIMVKHGWLEEPPQSPDRKKLVREN
ncbi:DUF3231 family protein [Rossellomorea vietnamensis]|uniref:DUF3231 family protein n=2 Tax=Rossellomorea vietnamensis TaxID=218284 RepID=A0A5D4NMG6_9BACI|nr:DUF3231 family protein [Rossellomorea vietnamensis]